MKKNTTDFKSFNYLENGRILFSNLDTIKCTKQLDSGLYSLNYEDFPNKEVILNKRVIDEQQNLINYHFINNIDKLVNKFFEEGIKRSIN